MKNKYFYSPLISIIVPIYKVEKYIAQCINSIIKQSYENIEIILIDDGSPDNSGLIADGYSKKDNRIKVIHTENRGVSAARNLGIEEARGEYIVFIDSDDYLASDYTEYMLSIIKKTGASFAISKNCFRLPVNEQQIENDKIEIYTPEEAATALLYPGYINIGCWNKMFNKDFLVKNKIAFLEKYYMGEGLNFIITAAQLSKGVGVGQKRVYYYRNDNPNSATKVLNIPKYFNALAAIDNIENKAIVNTAQFNNALKYHRYLTVFSALNAILHARADRTYPTEYKNYLYLIRKDALRLIKARISFSKKIRIWMFCINPKLAHFSIRLLGVINRKLNT